MQLEALIAIFSKASGLNLEILQENKSHYVCPRFLTRSDANHFWFGKLQDESIKR